MFCWCNNLHRYIGWSQHQKIRVYFVGTILYICFSFCVKRAFFTHLCKTRTIGCLVHYLLTSISFWSFFVNSCKYISDIFIMGCVYIILYWCLYEFKLLPFLLAIVFSFFALLCRCCLLRMRCDISVIIHGKVHLGDVILNGICFSVASFRVVLRVPSCLLPCFVCSLLGMF